MSTQYGEDARILAHFAGRVGRFLDIGASDGLTWSNTQPLVVAGWSGVMVEPAVGNLRWLTENHGGNPRVAIAPYLIARERGPRKFYECRDVSSTVAEHRGRWEAGGYTFRESAVYAITWQDLMEMYPPPYQFVNIDVEGMNLEVLRAMPQIHPEMICIELDPPRISDEVQRILVSHGLPHSERIGGNLLAWRS